MLIRNTDKFDHPWTEIRSWDVASFFLEWIDWKALHESIDNRTTMEIWSVFTCCSFRCSQCLDMDTSSVKGGLCTKEKNRWSTEERMERVERRERRDRIERMGGLKVQRTQTLESQRKSTRCLVQTLDRWGTILLGVVQERGVNRECPVLEILEKKGGKRESSGKKMGVKGGKRKPLRKEEQRRG